MNDDLWKETRKGIKRRNDEGKVGVRFVGCIMVILALVIVWIIAT